MISIFRNISKPTTSYTSKFTITIYWIIKIIHIIFLFLSLLIFSLFFGHYIKHNIEIQKQILWDAKPGIFLSFIFGNISINNLFLIFSKKVFSSDIISFLCLIIWYKINEPQIFDSSFPKINKSKHISIAFSYFYYYKLLYIYFYLKFW